MSGKGILVATDLSARSDRALERALELAQALGRTLTIIKVVDDAMPKSLVDAVTKQAHEHIEALVKKHGTEVETDLRVEAGDPVARLVEVTNGGEFDFAVVGRHRSRGFFDGLRRTTVESVIAQSYRPVLMVVSPVNGAYKKVLAPVAFSPACLQAVEKAHLIAPDADYRIYHAWSPPFEGLTGGRDSDYARAIERETAAAAEAWASDLPEPLRNVSLVQSGVATSFAQEAATAGADLIAVGANTRSISFGGLGSFTSELLREPPADVLIARGAQS